MQNSCIKYLIRHLNGEGFALNIWINDVSREPLLFRQNVLNSSSDTKFLVFSALLCSLAALLQSAGDMLPGIGFFISPFATAPIMLITVCSNKQGLLCYGVTDILLLFLQPSEALLFPFTTGLLGLSIGIAYSIFRKRISVVLFVSCLLLMGISFLLNILKFPVLGPDIKGIYSLESLAALWLFCVFYSMLWLEISLFIFRKLNLTFNK